MSSRSSSIAELFASGRPAKRQGRRRAVDLGWLRHRVRRPRRAGRAQPPTFSDATLAALRKVIPAFGSVDNPADVTAGVFNDMSLFTTTLGIVLADPGIDQLSILLASIGGAPGSARSRGDRRSGRQDRQAGACRLVRPPAPGPWAATDSWRPRTFPCWTTPVRLAQAAAVLAASPTIAAPAARVRHRALRCRRGSCCRMAPSR